MVCYHIISSRDVAIEEGLKTYIADDEERRPPVQDGVHTPSHWVVRKASKTLNDDGLDLMNGHTYLYAS